MAITFYPPNPVRSPFQPTIFLAGSIEMGLAENWQTTFETALADVECTILNPRRTDWDASWEQSETNPEFVNQVNWEQDGIEQADIVVMYIDGKTKSPITLLEFGQVVNSGRLVIACQAGFWRRGNLEVMCRRHNIVLHESIDELIGIVQGLLHSRLN